MRPCWPTTHDPPPPPPVFFLSQPAVTARTAQTAAKRRLLFFIDPIISMAPVWLRSFLCKRRFHAPILLSRVLEAPRLGSRARELMARPRTFWISCDQLS